MKGRAALLCLLLAGCESKQEPGPRHVAGTAEQQQAVRLAYSEVQTMIFCAGPQADLAAQLEQLERVRAVARSRGLGPLVSQTQEQWLESMATADVACPRGSYPALVAKEIDELAALINEVQPA